MLHLGFQIMTRKGAPYMQFILWVKYEQSRNALWLHYGAKAGWNEIQ